MKCFFFYLLRRAIPVRILTVGKKRSQGTQLLVHEYKEKIGHYCSIEDVRISLANTNVITKYVVQVVVLNEHGADIMSNDMADLIGDAGRRGSSRLVFCIGGPYGHGPLLHKRADLTIRLSSMVLNHQIALLVLLEQLYRDGINCVDTDILAAFRVTPQPGVLLEEARAAVAREEYVIR
ncbi:Putative RNA methyltransferase [Apostasia shenzhenica]|uniref:Ribulose bisphosphate carboxylase large chain n=1 Tax=Apostasia shenzhenica TaxID=1088818 RepID=A0A2I0B853_9ASPA|nr:Putative RNA methyltransferase [Apostasia shenzhenica]